MVCYIPQESRFREVADGFEVWWDFPQVAGAIDGTHIQIICPNIVLQTIVIERDFILLSCRLLWTFEDCSWIPTLGGQGKYMMSGCSQIHPYVIKREGNIFLPGIGKLMECRYTHAK